MVNRQKLLNMSYHPVYPSQARDELMEWYHQRRRTGPRTRYTRTFLHGSRRHMPPPPQMERDYQRHVRRGRRNYPQTLFNPDRHDYAREIREMTDRFTQRGRHVTHANRMRERRLARRATRSLPREVRDRITDYISPESDRFNYITQYYTNEPEYFNVTDALN